MTTRTRAAARAAVKARTDALRKELAACTKRIQVITADPAAEVYELRVTATADEARQIGLLLWKPIP
jgi:NADP-dependent 3-hydroxy acid dehydrogenase YdfG